MIKCSPVWALVLSTVRINKSFYCVIVLTYHFFFARRCTKIQGLYSWSFYIINNDLPKYLNDILHVSIEKNGIYSSIPKILSVIVSIGSGFMCDLMLNKFHYDRTCVRKMFVVLSE